MKNIELQLEPLSCPSCIKRIEGTLNKTKGVKNARVLFNSSKVKAKFDEDAVTMEAITETVEKLGYPVVSQKAS